ncbi:MAG TPA: DUF5989 family protein [Verrucomicrobiae bacterium]|jgi:hypothetical protein|nr:DUF5989 family protein [Verrucomicrobiae bacterium]
MRRFLLEVWRFLREEKKWWLLPVVIFFLLVAGLVYFTQGRAPLSPFMYSVK